ncbi:MAG: alpha-galactosidase [Clostridia bacterium]|nr:alpha-galactosidase [Clostridia bacterium]
MMNYINRTTASDMKLIADILKFTSADAVPLKFTYGDEEISGIPKSFSPTVTYRFIDTNAVQYVIEGTDSLGLNIRAEYIEYRDYPVTEWVFFITNKSDKDTPVLKNIRLEGELICSDATLEYGNGDTCHEDGYTFFKKRVEEKITLSPKTGTSCEGAFPYMTLHGSDREIRAAIGFPAKWRAEISKSISGVLFSCGQDRCQTKLHSGETYRTPRLNLMAYTNEDAPYRGINMWRSWCFNHIVPRSGGQPISPRLCLHYFQADGKPEFTGATEENQIHALNEYLRRDMKPDLWWFDAGWYPCNYEWHHTGTWTPDPVRFPRGLAPLGEACAENGVDFLLWFEPERVREGTELYEKHPEWILSATQGGDYTRNNHLLNLGNPEALEWVINHVDGIIKESGIKVYRQDFNMNPLQAWIENEESDRIGMIENLHVQGYLRYWDELLLRNPGLWIDSCASGGRRNDLETMRRAVTLHYTDVGYGNHPIKQKQHREMFEWIPYFRAHNMSWDNPDGSYGHTNKSANEYDFHCALAPALTSMCTYDDTEEHFELGRKMHKIWRKAAELELTSDYYPITECRASAEDWYAMQFDNEREGVGFVQAIRNTLAEGETYVLVPPMVHEGCKYSFTDSESGSEFTLTAEEFKKGIEFAMPKRTGKIYFYTFK